MSTEAKQRNLIDRSTDAERSCGRQVDVDSADGPSDVIQALIGVAQARVCAISRRCRRADVHLMIRLVRRQTRNHRYICRMKSMASEPAASAQLDPSCAPAKA